ncbi:hypothetical protein WOLCODRAFT_136499 [Wolfiporia cocos MD-104 SS10]|uniref:Uncharacterized protein n=1 Tax=Wolfiporia cocos (strain MD-104) TaxID=742152 RepID=A0A2H3JC12_WOLCO|nr:hypothetical protein WOLCODRAFT_136499 [Wolfiporia cocos MD-104 SS10]
MRTKQTARKSTGPNVPKKKLAAVAARKTAAAVTKLAEQREVYIKKKVVKIEETVTAAATTVASSSAKVEVSKGGASGPAAVAKAAKATKAKGTASTSATSKVTVASTLSGCRPSLAHLAPILAKLGITRMEHLRALGSMSEETRDRQVKEPALQKGMKMMEWAILVDRLQSL